MLSSIVREGRWTLAPRNRFAAVLGQRPDSTCARRSCPAPEVEIERGAVLGSVEILVPEGVHVEVTGGGVLSSQQLRLPGPAPAGAPVVRIRAGGALGSLKVRCKPRLVDQLKDTARRLADRFGSPPRAADGAARRDPRRVRARRRARPARARGRGGDRAVRRDAAGRVAAGARPRRRGLEERAAFSLTLNAINFGSGWFPTLRKAPGMSGFRTVEAGLRAHGPWTADALAAMTPRGDRRRGRPGSRSTS